MPAETLTPEQTDNGVIESTATELVPVPQPPATLFRTDDPVQVVEKATAVADALKDVIVKRGLFTMIQGKAHVQVEGWQLVGAMLGVTAVCVETEPVEGGYKATVEARTSDGRVVGRADALCTKDEKRGPWKNADDYARLSMAQTRATSKALKGPLGFVVSMAGYATTPAEEMTFAEQTKPAAEPESAATVTQVRGKELFDRAALEVGIDPQRISMWLTQHDVDHEPIVNRGTGRAAVSKLPVELDAELDQWISDEAEKATA